MQNQQIKTLKKKMVRSRLATVLVIARLSWGELMSPLHWYHNFAKIFPQPRKSIYKQGLVNYFFRN